MPGVVIQKTSSMLSVTSLSFSSLYFQGLLCDSAVRDIPIYSTHSERFTIRVVFHKLAPGENPLPFAGFGFDWVLVLIIIGAAFKVSKHGLHCTNLYASGCSRLSQKPKLG